MRLGFVTRMRTLAYLDHLVQGGSDVIVVSEHWLWPYELHKLDEFNSEYQGLGKTDPRLRSWDPLEEVV